VYDTVQEGNVFPMLVSSKVSATLLDSKAYVYTTHNPPSMKQRTSADDGVILLGEQQTII
jgi:hypothetical protein